MVVSKVVKSLIGRNTGVFQSWWSVAMTVLAHFPITHVLCRLCSWWSSDLPTIIHDVTRFSNAISTIALHSWPPSIVLNSWKQTGTVGEYFDQVHRPLRSFQDPSPFISDFPTTSEDLFLAFRSAKCDGSFIYVYLYLLHVYQFILWACLTPHSVPHFYTYLCSIFTDCISIYSHCTLNVLNLQKLILYVQSSWFNLLDPLHMKLCSFIIYITLLKCL